MGTLHTEVDGVRIEGVIHHRGRYELAVEITRPFRGERAQAPHIPYFARHLVTREGEAGDRVARELLVELYRTLEFIRDNQASLSARFETQLRPQIEVRARAIALLAEQRRALRKMLRAGELSHRTYQARVEAQREAGARLEYERHEAVHQFIEANFPAGLAVDPDRVQGLIAHLGQ